MELFIAGLSTMAFAASGLFFLRFWKRTADRLFMLFALAFWLLAIERIVLAFTDSTNEMRPFVYVLRLCAFLLIGLAVLDKNVARKD